MIRIDVESFKQCFKEKEGVVINTFHGVKGEEYTTVIAFGLLYGYVPHWNIINNSHTRYNIKVMDPDTAPRYKKYIPYWA